MVMNNFSVLMSIYNKECPHRLKESLDSIVNQSVLPNEIVIVKDGPLNENLEQVLNLFQNHNRTLFKIVSLDKNYGLGYALSKGLENCSNDIVARMDSDDICALNRFERQLQVMVEGDFDIIGTNIQEFDKFPGDQRTYRRLPEIEKDIVSFSRFRNPFNHPTVMFRKKIAIDAGNYSANYMFFEDWHLFVRMIRNGSKVYNIQEILLFFRVSDRLDVIKRRSGFKYLCYEYKFSKFLLFSKHINIIQWFFYLITKLPMRLLPPSLLKWVYYKIAR